jgi:YVTN family beta-propeller protein
VRSRLSSSQRSRNVEWGGTVSRIGRTCITLMVSTTSLVFGLSLVDALPVAASVSPGTNGIPANPGPVGTVFDGGTVTVLCQQTISYACTNGGYDTTSAENSGWPWTYYGGSNASRNSNGNYHNCTLYSAYRLEQNGYGNPGWSANATDWATEAFDHGVKVNQTPAVGSIAQWNGVTGDPDGHVAYVESVSASGNIDITEDNYYVDSGSPLNGGYTASYEIKAGSSDYPDNFIHFDDTPPPPNGYAYVANETSNNVSVIKTSTNSVVKTVTVGSEPYDVAITPNGGYAYVTNQDSDNVSVIKTSTDTVVKTVTVGGDPEGVAITPNGSYAYVTNAGSNNVSVIKTSTNTVVKTVTVGGGASWVAFTPNGSYAYVTNAGSNNVSVIKTSTNAVVKTVTVGGEPLDVAITPNGSYAYVTNADSNNVSVIKTSTNTVVKTVTVSAVPVAVAFTPNGSYAYVTNEDSNTVSVIATNTDKVVKTVTVGTTPTDVAFTPNGSYAYVTNADSNNVSVIKTSTNTVVKAVTVGSSPIDVAIT